MPEVRLEVKRRQPDTVECWMCVKDSTIFDTIIELNDTAPEQYGGITLCVEHMDSIVVACLTRHSAEMINKNARWYERADEEADPDQLSEEEWLLQHGT
jgi:phosphopantetheine adenylyltransferase